MTPEQFKAARKRLGLSQRALARFLGVRSYRTVQRWEAGQNDIPKMAAMLMNWLAWGEPPEITKT